MLRPLQWQKKKVTLSVLLCQRNSIQRWYPNVEGKHSTYCDLFANRFTGKLNCICSELDARLQVQKPGCARASFMTCFPKLLLDYSAQGCQQDPWGRLTSDMRTHMLAN